MLIKKYACYRYGIQESDRGACEGGKCQGWFGP